MTEENKVILDTDKLPNFADTFIDINTYKRLEQERDELKKTCEKCKLFDIEKTNRNLLEQIEKLKQENKALQAYKDINEDFKKAWEELNEKYKQLRSALEEINRVVKLAHKVEDYLLGQDYTNLVDRIEKEINEVLND